MFLLENDKKVGFKYNELKTSIASKVIYNNIYIS